MKRILCLLIAIIFSLSPSFSASALYHSYDIARAGDKFGSSAGYFLAPGMESREINGLGFFHGMGSVWPGSEAFVPFRDSDFIWGDSMDLPPLTLESATQAGMRVWTERPVNTHVFDKLELSEKNGSLGILLDFKDIYDCTDPARFSIKAGIEVNGMIIDGSIFYIEGRFENRKVRVRSLTESIRLGAGLVAEAYEDNESIVYELDGASVYTSLEYPEKAYARLSAKPLASDREVMSKYSGITHVYHLAAVNIKGRIFFNSITKKHVYDARLNYLGTSDMKLPLKERYYLSDSPIS